jgi:folate-binding protein YgfZ
MEDAELEVVSEPLEWWSLHGGGPDAIVPSIAMPSASVRAEGKVGWVTPTDRFALVDSSHDFGEASVPLSDEEFQAFRLEYGFPWFGIDYTPSHKTHDASLERRAVDWSKGCYLGQEVVCMQDMRGKARYRLLPFTLEAGALPARGAPVLDSEGKAVGDVTSAAMSERLGAVVLLARIQTASAETALHVDGKALSPLGSGS